MIAFLISWLSDLLSLNHPTVLFALCIATFVLICVALEWLEPYGGQPASADPPPDQDSPRRSPGWYEPAAKGFHKATVVPFVTRSGVRRVH